MKLIKKIKKKKRQKKTYLLKFVFVIFVEYFVI